MQYHKRFSLMQCVCTHVCTYADAACCISQFPPKRYATWSKYDRLPLFKVMFLGGYTGLKALGSCLVQLPGSLNERCAGLVLLKITNKKMNIQR